MASKHAEGIKELKYECRKSAVFCVYGIFKIAVRVAQNIEKSS